MSLNDKAKADAKSEHAKTQGGWFKFKEGANRMRLLSEPEAIYEDFNLGMCYTGCNFKGTIKYLAYILHYEKQEDGSIESTIKLMKIPYSIFQWIASLEFDDDWKFEGFPMPYDINVEAVGAGTKEVKYNPKASPKSTKISDDILAQLAKKPLVSKIIETLKKRNEDKHKEDGTYERLHQEKEETEEQIDAKFGIPPKGIDYPTEDINPDDIPF